MIGSGTVWLRVSLTGTPRLASSGSEYRGFKLSLLLSLLKMGVLVVYEGDSDSVEEMVGGSLEGGSSSSFFSFFVLGRFFRILCYSSMSNL